MHLSSSRTSVYCGFGGVVLLAASFVVAPAPPRHVRSDDPGMRSPDKIFAATCATCHGERGLGGRSWSIPGHYAPLIAWAMDSEDPKMEERFKFIVRNGSYEGLGFDGAMPAFGPQVITDEELDALVRWILYAPPLGGAIPGEGVPPPPRPDGREILVEITDEAPWFRDDGTDARDPFRDRRRVVLSEGEYLKVVNLGMTWHTVTNGSCDTGFIGPSTHLSGQHTGYYYLTAEDLHEGAHKYICKLHPYMQLEIVTPGHDPTPLTHVSKVPIGVPTTPGIGEVWVGLQTYTNPGSPDGAVAVIDADTWRTELIPNVGNNPHNGWFGTSRDLNGVLRNVVVYANWHDVGVTILDADSRAVLGTVPVGAANAHVMTAPNTENPVTGADRWFVTIMGSNKIQEIDPFDLLATGRPSLLSISQADGVYGRPGMSPHGLWFADDGEHFLTANTLANTVSLYSVSTEWFSGGYSGVGMEIAQVPTDGTFPLAAAIMNTGDSGSTLYRGFSNNAGTSDISLFDIDLKSGSRPLVKVHLPPPLGNAAGNLALSDMMASPVRWVHMPIQAIVSPPDSTSHGRYLVVCNKASMNVSIVPLDATGTPQGVYTFPAGLGSHGVAFGRKKPGPKPSLLHKDTVGYYAYVTNTFENYVSVYDLELLEKLIHLEKLGRAPKAFLPGGATESVYVQGYASEVAIGRSSALLPITLFSPDVRGLVHVGDIPLKVSGTQRKRSYLKEHVWLDLPGYGMVKLDLDVKVDTGAMGIFVRPLPAPWRTR